MFRAANGQTCLLIALEGADRVGKATQAKLLEQALNKRGHQTTVEEIPYQDKVTHSLIYKMLRNGAVRKHPLIFQTLQGLNRRYFQTHYLPTLAQHFEIVVLDRWTLSTFVYGAVDGVTEEETAEIVRGIVEPDLILVLDAPPFPKTNPDILEADDGFQRAVRSGYLEWCEKRPEMIVKIDAHRPPDEVHSTVLAEVIQRLAR